MGKLYRNSARSQFINRAIYFMLVIIVVPAVVAACQLSRKNWPTIHQLDPIPATVAPPKGAGDIDSKVINWQQIHKCVADLQAANGTASEHQQIYDHSACQ